MHINSIYSTSTPIHLILAFAVLPIAIGCSDNTGTKATQEAGISATGDDSSLQEEDVTDSGPTDTVAKNCPESCDDGNACTVDSCDSIKGCQHASAANGTSCDNEQGTCQSGACLASKCQTDADCSHTSCTAASCVTTPQGKQCQNRKVADGTSCADGNTCNGAESCQAGVCAAGQALNCDDNNVCTADSCDPTKGCQHSPVANGTSCDSGKGACQSGSCLVSKCQTDADCSHTVCTAGSCTTTPQGKQCQYQNLADGTSCTDGNVCNGAEICQAGTCAAGQALVCSDNNVCTADSCDPTKGCQHSPVANGTSCSDDNACNGAESCQAGVCATGQALVCNDNNDCTSDACNPSTGCQYTPLADGNACGTGGKCQKGACKVAAPPAYRTDPGRVNNAPDIAGVVTDSAGNSCLVGNFNGTVDFGGGPLTAVGGNDVYIACYDEQVKHRWSRAIGGSADSESQGDDQFASAIALDGSGNLIIGGTFTTAIDFKVPDAAATDGSTLAPIDPSGAQGFFLASVKMSDGKANWARSIKLGQNGVIAAIAGDMSKTNEVVLALEYDGAKGAKPFGTSDPATACPAVPTIVGSPEMMVVRLNTTDGTDANGSPSFACVASATFTGTSEEVPLDIAVDKTTGDGVIVGRYKAPIADWALLAINGTNPNAFIARFDSKLTRVWAKGYGDISADTSKIKVQSPQSIALDGSGNAVFTGYMAGHLSMGSDASGNAVVVDTNNQGTDIVLAKLDGATGATVFAKVFGDTNDSQVGNAVAIESNGNITIGGFLKGATDFGGGLLNSAGNNDAFLATFAPDGTHLRSALKGDSYSQTLSLVKRNNGPAGGLWIVPKFTGTLTFEDDALVATGASNSTGIQRVSY